MEWDFFSFQNVPSSFRKPSGTIDVIGGQTATISRVEGRRRHNLDGNNIQVRRQTVKGSLVVTVSPCVVLTTLSVPPTTR